MSGLLRVDEVRVSYGARRHRVDAVRGVSFELAEGGCLGLVGESGSGKSSLARAIVGLQPVTDGTIEVRGNPVGHRPGPGGVQMIFQDPIGSLNPRRRLLDVLAEPLRLTGRPRGEARTAAAAALRDVGLDPETYADRSPGQLSGGQAQRAAIARTVLAAPALIVADEPVSGLDVSVQAGIVSLLHDLRARHGTGLVFISHDLAVVRTLCDDTVVLHDGIVVERGSVESVLDHPKEPYTRTLVAAANARGIEGA